MFKLRIRLPKFPHRAERGQSLVEFALLMPVLLILLMGALDIGRMYFSFIAIQNAAGEGALYAAINPRCVHPGEGPNCADPDNATFRAANESAVGAVDWRNVTIEVTPADRSALLEGDPITITVHYDYPIMTPVVAPLFPDGSITLTAHAVQNVINLEQ